MRKFLLSIVTALAILASVSAVAYAYMYRAQVAITENASTSYTMVPLWWDANNDFMATNGFMNSTANDTRVQTLAGTAKPRMVADNKTLTAVPITADSQLNLYFSTGETEQETSEIITGYGGSIFTADAASIELADNFSWICGGCWFDAATSGNITDKPYAFSVSGDGSGNITAGIFNNAGTSASGAAWTNPSNVTDNNTATSANTTVGAATWSGYITMATANKTAVAVAYWWDTSDTDDVNQYDLDVYDGSWNSIVSAGTPGSVGQWNVITFTTGNITPNTSQVRIRFRNNGPGSNTVDLYELQVMGQTPDLTVNASGISSGEHTIEVLADNSYLRLYIDGVEQDKTLLP